MARTLANYDHRGMDIAGLLAESDLFSGFDTQSLERVATSAQVRSLKRNDVVFGEDDPADELFVVQSGRIAIAYTSPDGRESVIALMEAGDLFGEMPLFDDVGRAAAARALEASELVAVPYDPVHAALDARPELLWGVV